MIGQWTSQWLQKNHFPVYYFTSTSSTSAVAKEAALSEQPELVFYIADEQTQGRGQGTRSWLNSNPGTNLLLTASLQSQLPPQPELCLSIGKKLQQICSHQWPQLKWHVKPPNDLYLENKKVAGILLESISQGTKHRLLVGLGFNVLDFPQSNDFAATSLQEHCTPKITKETWDSFVASLVKIFPLNPS